ncbi:MAG: cytidylyltransferase [Alphaproteobacteria bacterium]|nr:cytidylyltransferase [Alphaproteobacteria bacterium]
MIAAILIGREGSTGFPGKNVFPVLGRPLVSYPLLAAQKAPSIDRIYVSTDSEAIKTIARDLGAVVIERPDYLCTKEALGEDAYVHAYGLIKADCAEKGEELELLVLLMANAPTISVEQLEEGIRVLRAQPETDSAVTVSCYNMWSPLRARKVDSTGHLKPFVPFETFGDPKTLNCDRDSQGDVWFADMGMSIVRPQNLDCLEDGILPQKWMGQTIWPIKNYGGLDVDYDYQMPQAEFWLKKNGVLPA